MSGLTILGAEAHGQCNFALPSCAYNSRHGNSIVPVKEAIKMVQETLPPSIRQAESGGRNHQHCTGRIRLSRACVLSLGHGLNGRRAEAGE